MAEDDWAGEECRAIPDEYEAIEPIEDWADIQAPLIDDEAVYKVRAANLGKESRERLHFETVELGHKVDKWITREREESIDDGATVKTIHRDILRKKVVYRNSNKSIHVHSEGTTQPDRREHLIRESEIQTNKHPEYEINHETKLTEKSC